MASNEGTVAGRVSTRGLSGEAKLAARREQNRINKAAQRVRDAAGVRPQRPSIPRPKGNVAERAAAYAAYQRERRVAVISKLFDVRNPEDRIRVPEQRERARPERKTDKGRKTQAETIRRNAASHRLQVVGRKRKQQLVNELLFGENSDRLQQTLSKSQQERFQQLSERIASGSQQSTAILFNYAGGQNMYSSATERILASPESANAEDGLKILEKLANLAESAAKMWSPKQIGRLTV